MPNPCPNTTDTPGCYGPFRVQLKVSLDVGYEDVWTTPPGGGLPGALMSEVNIALLEAFNEQPPDTTATVTAVDPYGEPVSRTATVQTGVASLFRGPANRRMPDTISSVDDNSVQLWTAEVWIYATTPLTAHQLDYAYIAGQWAKRLEVVNTASDAVALVEMLDVWFGYSALFTKLNPAYPGSADRDIQIS